MAKRYYLSEEDRRKLKQELGSGSKPARRGTKRFVQDNSGAVMVKITSAVSEGPNKWHYNGTIVRGQVDINGTFSWDIGADPDYVGYLYNGCEAFNLPDPSIRGNGVNSGGSGYPTGFDLQPIRGEPVVLAWPVRVTSEDPNDVGGFRLIYVFNQPNADDGVCE